MSLRVVAMIALGAALVPALSSPAQAQPMTIAISSGGSQTTTVSTNFTNPLVALVTDGSSNPVSGATVTFTAPSSGASGTFLAASNGGTCLSSGGSAQLSCTATTNSSGLASSLTFTANDTAGSYNVGATSPGTTPSPLNFSETNTAGTAATIAISSGDSQTTTVSTNFTNPLVALVTDTYGNPVPGATVTFTAPASGASGTFTDSATNTTTAITDASGDATASTFKANATAGSYNVGATSPGTTPSPLNFSETNTAGTAATIAISSGDSQTTTVSTNFTNPLVALVTDTYGNPVPGATVTFTAPASGASGTFTDSATNTTTAITDASGDATASTFKANATAGSYNVGATSPGTTPSPLNFSETNTAGTAATIAISSGGSQTTTVSTNFTNPLVALVTDGSSNPVSGATVTFTAPSSGASGTFLAASNGGTCLSSGGSAQLSCTATTNSSGLASSLTFKANATAGSYNVGATSPGTTPSPLNFSETNTAGTAATIAISSGGSQTTTVSTNFTNPLVALVTDGSSNPVSGATVTFTAPSSGASGTFLAASNGGTCLSSGGSAQLSCTATTNSSGLASSLTFKANATAGSYNVGATSPGTTPSPLNFSETNTAGTAATIAISSGGSQTTTVSTNFTNPLVALVTDGSSNPVSGATVTFTAPSSGASGTFLAASNGGTCLSSGGSAQLSCTATTNSSGLASSLTFKANATAGSYNVGATSPGTTPSPLNFSETNTAGTAATIAISSGGSQTTTVSTNFTNPLVALVTDGSSNPVSGATVTFTAPSSGASGTFLAASNGGTCLSSGGSAQLSCTATTNSSGLASSLTFKANATAGSYNVGATSPGTTPSPLNFSETNTAGTAATIAISSGGSQTTTVSTNFTNPLVALVTDGSSNPVSGATVTFTAPSSGASGTFLAASNGGTCLSSGGSAQLSCTATTNSSGLASSLTFKANATAGSYNVGATSPGTTPSPLNFSETNTAGTAATIAISSGGSQTTTVSTNFTNPLVALVTDGSSNPVSGATVTFTAPSSGASGTFLAASNGGTCLSSGGSAQLSCTATTNSSGLASSLTFKANATAGSYNVGATSPGTTPSPLNFSETNTAGTAATIAISSGGSQTTTVSTNFTNPLVALVTDGSSNPVSGATVTFTAPSSGASGTFLAASNGGTCLSSGGSAQLSCTATTNSSGLASSLTFKANATAGSYNVGATSPGTTPSPLNFSETNTAGTAATIAISSGGSQTTTVSTNFTNPLVALVTDGSSNPVSGATVTFTAPSSGASGTFLAASNGGTCLSSGGSAQLSCTATTNSSGLASSLTFKANATAGSYNVGATSPGTTPSPLNFSETNTAGTAATIAISSGGSQTTTVSTNFTNPLVALVTDGSSNPVSDATVTFTAPSSGASGTFLAASNGGTCLSSGGSAQLSCTATTNSSGLASSLTFKANATAGSYNVGATSPGTTPSPLNFSETNTAGTAATIAISSGGSQTTTVSTNFTNPLVALVTDGSSNPVSGATVTFTAPSSGASGTFLAASNGGTCLSSGGSAQLSCTATTNSSGLASSLTFKANATAGSYNVGATSPGTTPSPLNFSETNTAGTAATIAISSGGSQTTTVSTNFTNPLVALVTDGSSNPVSGATVTFTAPSSGASGTFLAASNGGTCLSSGGSAQLSCTATTNSSGLASSLTFKANATAGSYNVGATSPGTTPSPLNFSETNTAGTAATIAISSGGSQTTTVSTNFTNPLVALVTDGSSNPVSDATVTFTAPSSGASGTFLAASNGGTCLSSGGSAQLSCTATTNSSGLASSLTFKANATAGSYNVGATSPGTTPSPLNFSETNTAGTAATIAISSGGSQTTTVSTNFTNPLVALVTDGSSNPVSGATVTFTAPSSGASGTFLAASNGGTCLSSGGSAQLSCTATTNSSGLASSLTFKANATAGSYNVGATSPGTTPSPLNFSETNTAGTAATIAISSGGSQTTTVSTNFTNPLVALVTDGSSNPVSGATVTFTAPSSGASGTFLAASNGGTCLSSGGSAQLSCTATTNSSGLASSLTFKANATAGSYNVGATSPGTTPSPLNFSETNTAVVNPPPPPPPAPPASTTITQTAPLSDSTTQTKSSSFTDTLTTTGNTGAVTFTTSSAPPGSAGGIRVSSSGVVTTTGALSAGTYKASGTDSDSSGDTGTWSFSLTVAATAITQIAPTTGTTTTGKTFTGQLKVSGSNGTITYTQSTGTPHLTVSSSGKISAPATLAAGAYKATGTVKDTSGDTGTWGYSLTVSATKLTQAAPTTATTTTDKAFTGQLEVSGANGTVTYTQSTGAPHLTVSSSGAVSAPATLPAGTYKATGSVKDTSGDTGTWSFALTVTANKLTQVAPTTATTTTDKTFSGQLEVSDAHGTVTYTQSTGAPHLTVSSSGAVSAPATLPPGTYHATGTVKDTSGDTGTWSFALTVTANKLIQVAPITATTTLGKAFTGQLNVSGAHGTVTYTQSTGAPHLTVSSSGKVSAPATLPAGTYNATGTVKDTSGDTGTWSFALTVTTNKLIQAAPTTATTTLGKAFTGQLNVSGSHGTVTYSQLTGAPHLTISSSGKVSAAATLATGTYNATGTLKDTFGDTGTWSFALTVTPTKLTQVAPTTATTATGKAFTGQLEVSGSHGTVTYSQLTGAPHLTISSSGKVSAAATLPAGTYRAAGASKDTLGDTGTWSFALTVTPTKLTQVAPTTATTATGKAFTGQLEVSGSHGTVTYSQLTGAPHLTISSSGKVSAAATLPAGTYRAAGASKDTLGDTGTWSFALTVTPTKLTQLTPDKATITTGKAFTGQLEVSGKHGAVTYAQSTGAPHLRVSSSGQVSVAATLAAGTYKAQGTARDVLGDTGTWSFALTVTATRLTQVAPDKATTAAAKGFTGHLEVAGAHGTVTYAQSTGAPRLTVSSSGKVSAAATLVPGTYRAQGTAKDILGDTGTWSFSLTVTATTLTQLAPDTATAATGKAFTVQLEVSGSSGTVTYAQSTGAPHLKVSSSGKISAAASLAAGTYKATGTAKDTYGDTGKWTFTLTVKATKLTQIAPKSGTTTAGQAFFGQLKVSGAHDTVTYTQLTGAQVMTVSSSGKISAPATLAAATYEISGTVKDSLGDQGTWTYTFIVTNAVSPQYRQTVMVPQRQRSTVTCTHT